MRWLVLLLSLAMPVVSWFSQQGVFGPTNGAISDRYPTLIVAAGYAFERIPAVADLIMATLDGLWLDWLRRGDEVAVKNGLDGCVLFARLRLGGS